MNIGKNSWISPTPTYLLGKVNENALYIKREDLLPFSFGGNKARKAMYFLEEIKGRNADCVVTYGSSSSNHCRIVANIAASTNLKCVIVSPEENENSSFNLQMMKLFGADIVYCPVSQVSKTINDTLDNLRAEGYCPYFIPGGGHGTLGTRAYVDCFDEILKFEIDNGIHFDYIFHASGTGTTQAGLVCGKILNEHNVNIVGISIARRNPYGKQVVVDSINEYLSTCCVMKHQEEVLFVDEYVLDGYGKHNSVIDQTIHRVLLDYGIPLDSTYTGKAFWGMTDYIAKEKIIGKNVLFIHTGGTPLFFDYLGEM